MEKLTTMDLRRSLGALLDQVFYRGDAFLITRRGVPLACLGPVPPVAADDHIVTKSVDSDGVSEATDV